MPRRGAAGREKTEPSIEEFLKDADFGEVHSIRIRASPAAVDAAVRELDITRSRVVRLLFALRRLPSSMHRLDGMQRIGFTRLAEEPERRVVLGLIGRFWTPSGGLRRFDAADFAAFREPGWAKAVWEFRSTPLDGGATLLETETRVSCTDAASRRRFRLYWLAVRPFSGLIRRLALAEIRRSAEARQRAFSNGAGV